MNNYKELIVWQKSMVVVEKVYRLTATFPNDEKFGLTSQTKRSAVSIASNIAEGAGRNSDNEFKHFLGIANGSLNELCTQLELSKRLEIINQNENDEMLRLCDEVQKMVYALIKKFSQI